MSNGKVKWFNKVKGYGFIVPTDGGEDVFIHVTTLEKAGLKRLEENQEVQYEAEIKDGRLRAVTISSDDIQAAA